ncbi:F-box domain containing protein [Tanacetum coccineum]
MVFADKSWLEKPRGSREFYDGVQKFVAHCTPLVNSAGKIRCPCKRCRNILFKPIEWIGDHITDNGWDPLYTVWDKHGEPALPTPPLQATPTPPPLMSDMTALLDDLSYIPPNNEHNEPTQGDIGETSNEPTQATRNEFEELYSSANEALYPGCDHVTRLDFMAKFTYFKVKGKLTDSIFNEMLEWLQYALPESKGYKFPPSYYAIKKTFKTIGLGYESIHACEYDCCLFRGEVNKDLQFCPSRDERRTTQNSGICAPGPDGEMSYGQLQEILEFKYLSFKVALFRVKWFDTRNNGRVKKLTFRNGMTQIIGSGEWWKNDQYILATQVKQVFYLEDPAKPNVKVVEHVNHKKFFNRGVIVVENEPDIIHLDNSFDLPPSTSGNDLDNVTFYIDLHIDGESTEVDTPPDIIDVPGEDDDITDDEETLPHDLADSDDEDLINDDDDVMSADVARSHSSNDGGEDRPPPHHVPSGCMGCFSNREDDMLKAQIKVVDILCDLELIYPLALFDIMIHLVIHLPLKALEGGPIRPRWMFPFERYIKKLKGYVRNKAKPEGLIAEGYVAEEALTFSSHYFWDVTTKFNHPDRNANPPPTTCQFQVFRSVCKSIGLRSVIQFDAQELKKVKWYVLHNSPEIDTYRSQFKRLFPSNRHEKHSPGVVWVEDPSNVTQVRKPNLGGRAAGRLNTDDKTRNLSLKEITDKKGPVPIRFELRDKQTLMPLGDHAAHWSSYIGEVIRGVPLYYPSWLKVPKERKAALITDIGTQFDLRPHMESPDWTEINAGIQQHLQKAYNTNKAAFKAQHWVIDPTTGTYNVEKIRRARPEDITAEEWDKGRAQPLRSTRRSLTPSSWHTLLTGNSFRMRTDVYTKEMRRLRIFGHYTDDEINRLARRGKQRGHIPGVGRFESGGASGSGGCGDDEESADDQEDEDEDGDGDMGPTVSLGIVAGEGIPVELSPANIPQRQVARERYPQRHVARESTEFSPGKVYNVVV